MGKNPAPKIAYFSFDDGPLRNTKLILDVLKRYHVKATFFVVGNPTRYGFQMYRRIIRDGHGLGNHSYSHHYPFIYASREAFHKDFSRLESLLLRATGKKPTMMRFPGGTNNTKSNRYGGKKLMPILARMMTKQGYRYFDWNVDSGDAQPQRSKEQIVRNVLNGCRNKQRAIILMHDFNDATPQALPVLIRKLRRRGFTFDRLSRSSFCYQFKV